MPLTNAYQLTLAYEPDRGLFVFTGSGWAPVDSVDVAELAVVDGQVTLRGEVVATAGVNVPEDL